MDLLLRRLRRLAADRDPDGRLLARYAATGDPAAVEELVRRHGPLVYAAARRRLPDPADAADVFQATFLVLLQKGGRLTDAAGIGPWLYRVAALTARNLRRKNARRLARRRPLLDVPIHPTHELRADLDNALLTLSERDRAAVVLCHLQGYTRREAAERLGVPEGTLSSVLSRALARLRGRLGDDPLPLLAVGSVVPAGVATAACQVAAVVRVASLTAAAGPAVVSLTRGALRMFWLKKVAAGGMAVAACLGVGVGVGLAPRRAAVAAADPPPKAEPPAAPSGNKDQPEVRPRLNPSQVRVRVASEQERVKGAAFITVTEIDSSGLLNAHFDCRDAAGDRKTPYTLGTHLRRARLESAVLPEVVLFVNVDGHPFGPFAQLEFGRIAASIVEAGYPTVTYSGPLPTGTDVGKDYDGKPTRVWTGSKTVSGERVELAKVLALDPPPLPKALVLVSVTYADWTYGRQAVELTGSKKVTDVVKSVATSRPVLEVFLVRRSAKGAVRDLDVTFGFALPVDWVGITQRGEMQTNSLLQPGDHVVVRLGK